MVVIVAEEASLHELAAIGVGGERERAERVGHELVGARGVRLLAVKEQELLKAALCDTSHNCR